MLYSESETAWLSRRAELIAKRTGWSLPIVRSEAKAELVRVRRRSPPVALRVLPIGTGPGERSD